MEKENRKEELIRRQVVHKFHAELERHYNLDTLRKVFPELNDDLKHFTQEDLDRAKEMFISVIYPAPENRHDMEKSFEVLIRMLKSPRKLFDTIPAMPVIIIKYGKNFPSALHIGLNSIVAFRLSRKLENQMTQNVLSLLVAYGVPFTEEYVLDDSTYFDAYLDVPYNLYQKMIRVAFWILNAGKQSRIAETAYNILNDVQIALIRRDEANVREGAEPIHNDIIEAIKYGKRTLRKIIAVLNSHTQEEIEKMVSTCRTVELAYLNWMFGKPGGRKI